MGMLNINGQPYTFNEGETILDVSQRNGIHIPTLCYLKDITPTGACRLCLVDVEGTDRLQASCVVFAKEGMNVQTDTEEVWKNRKKMLEMILIKHPLDCPVCDKAGECMLQDTAYEFGMMEETLKSPKPEDPIVEWNKIVYNSNLCVLCERCVKSCHEMTGCSALKMEDRGFYNHITPSREELKCDFCGTCIDRCPVGALLDNQFHHKARVWDLDEIETVSPHSPDGSSVVYGVKDGKIARGTATEVGQISAQDRFAFKFLTSSDRIVNPKSGGDKNWDETLNIMTDKLAAAKGSSDVALLLGSRISNEALASAKKLAESLGTNKVVTEAELALGSFLAKYKEKFGTVKNIGTFEDIKTSELIFVIGADFRREVIGVKWRMMNSIISKSGKVVQIGLKKQEYDFFNSKSFLADYGDFASVFSAIKSGSDDRRYEETRTLINEAGKVSFIIGNEYMAAESQLEAVFDLVDFVGKDKLVSFTFLNDQTNYMGALASGLADNGYGFDALEKDLKNGKVKAVINLGMSNLSYDDKLAKLPELIKSAGVSITADMFESAYSKNSTIVLPTKSSLEAEGTFTALDGKLVKFNKVVDSPANAKDEVEILSIIGGLLGVELPAASAKVFNTLVSGRNGYPSVDFCDVDGSMYVENAFEVKATSFKPSKGATKTKIVSVNSRYHNSILTAKSIEKDADSGKSFHFPLETEAMKGAGADFKGGNEDPAIAKGIVFVPKAY